MRRLESPMNDSLFFSGAVAGKITGDLHGELGLNLAGAEQHDLVSKEFVVETWSRDPSIRVMLCS